MSERKFSRKIIRNTIFNIVGRLWGILIALILTPYIVRNIGTERFGIWAVVGVLVNYLGLFDFGINSSFVKHIAEFNSRREYQKINRLVNSGMVFYLFFGAAVFGLTVFFRWHFIHFLNVPPQLCEDAEFAVILGVAAFVFSNVVSVFAAIQGGLQRMDITNILAVASSFIYIVATVFVLKLGLGLKGLMVANAAVLFISGVVNIAAAFKLLPGLSINPLLFSRDMLGKLFGFGYKLQLSNIASMLHFHMDKFILAHFLNIGSVAYYAIASQLAVRLRELPLILVSAVFPAASELEAVRDASGLNKLYLRSTKYVALAGFPIFGSGILLADSFIALWLGNGYERAVFTFYILAAGYFFNILTAPGFFVLNGMGKPEYGMRSSLLAAALNLGLSIILVITTGYFGVVTATALSMITAALYFILISGRCLKVSFAAMAKDALIKPCAASLAAVLLIYPVKCWAGIENWAGLIIMAVLYTLIFSLIILKLNYLDDFDNSVIKRLCGIRKGLS